MLETVERRFIWQARVATLLVAVSGFYMAARLDLWNRFRMIDFWWMHAMVLLWLVFTFILFIAEPLISARSKHPRKESHEMPAASLRLMQWLHWALLGLSSVTVLAAVAGSHGMLLVP